jgi:hypothetical protein
VPKDNTVPYPTSKFTRPANTARYAEGKTAVIEDRLSHRLVFAYSSPSSQDNNA